MVVNASIHRELGVKLLDLADALLAICPNCNVWIHEKQLYKLLKIKKGLNFGQRDCLSSIISGIDKGRWGGQRNPAVKRESGPIAGFALGNSDNSRVRFQEYGRPKPFEGGTNAVGDAKLNVPRYFVLGTPLCTLNEQMAIIDELIGVTNTLPDDVKKRRRDNFKKFNNCDINDGQYSELDSVDIGSVDLFQVHYRTVSFSPALMK
jgi:hypothetical protein